MAEHAEHQTGHAVRHPLTGQAPSKIIAVHVSYRSRAMERGRLDRPVTGGFRYRPVTASGSVRANRFS